MLFLFKFFLAIFIPVFAFCLYSRKFANPFKLTFIFGKKGSGKSTYMVKLMLRYLKKGWLVYTDMQDVIIPNVRIINARDLENFAPAGNSVLFLGEVGITYDNRNYSKFPEGIRDLFKFERKYKFRCYMDSQSYDIDKKLRDVVDGMYLQSNIGNVIGLSRPIYKSISLTEPSADSESRVAEHLKFAPFWKWKVTWMPRYHKYFDSFSAPARPAIPYKEVTADKLTAKQELRKINRFWNRSKKH